MTKILACFAFLFFSISNAQTKDLDSLIDVGIEQYNNEMRKEALQTWTQIEKSAARNSSTYGTVLGNILFYHIENDDEKKVLKYYKKIIRSKLNDKDRRYNKLGEPFKNYRYNAVKSVARYYAKKKDYQKALDYIDLADGKITYENTSLTAIKYEKVDLAFWKSWLYNDLGQKDKAFYVLTKRALEYDYKNDYKNWATAGNENDDDTELFDEIMKYDPLHTEKKEFKSGLELAFKNATSNSSKNTLTFTFRNMPYTIRVSGPEVLKNPVAYFRKSEFYSYLSTTD